jgi:hypothetical protein
VLVIDFIAGLESVPCFDGSATDIDPRQYRLAARMTAVPVAVPKPGVLFLLFVKLVVDGVISPWMAGASNPIT